jgi:hypothetical protein
VKIFKEKKSYYLISGYVFDLNSSIKFKYALLTMIEGASSSWSFRKLLFNDKFMIGAAYRWSAAMSAMVGFQVSDGMYIGYAWSWSTQI